MCELKYFDGIFCAAYHGRTTLKHIGQDGRKQSQSFICNF